MADINHAELSRDLALALGYYPESVRVVHDECQVFRSPTYKRHYWHLFEYRSPNVVLPLLEWLMREHRCEPGFTDERKWYLFAPRGQFMSTETYADTLAAAVARACIAVKGKG